MSDHTASLEESQAARLPVGYRDSCSAYVEKQTYASLLIPLNKCRRSTLYAPWKCEEERHTYESFLQRQKKLRQMVAEAAAAAEDD
ncbi:hypothetical protein MVES1_002122 [Malassezia vespertilionis]|uniref:uncharacterized protein n=1 Tax=Malassezia vespertilionis TaxID=2020962 RepID=UPI0024B1A079|nr:uncharacterized protein MVES1_002122 [Malassezia vespertilionis]WFD06768.1 hypothetical protein MVES1_002122 [Malassezia vespertilionis]